MVIVSIDVFVVHWRQGAQLGQRCRHSFKPDFTCLFPRSCSRPHIKLACVKGPTAAQKGERLDRDYTFNAASPTDQSGSTRRKTSDEWPVLEVHQIAPKRNSIEDEIAAAIGTPSAHITQSSTTKARTLRSSRSAKGPSTVELTKQLRKAIPRRPDRPRTQSIRQLISNTS